MKKFTFFNKLFFTLLTLLIFGVGFAWAGNVTLKATAEASPSTQGFVYVAKSNSAPSSYTLTSDYASETKFSLGTNWTGYLTVSQDFYLFASAKDGYGFTGWSKNSSDTSGDTSNPKSITVSGKNSGTVTDGPYYAHFTPVTVDDVASYTSTLNFTQPGNASTTIKFNVSNADATADFTYSLTGELRDETKGGWVVDSWSYSNNQVSIKLKYYCTKYTAQSSDLVNHKATITLTSNATNGTYKSADVYANVDLTPTISANPTSKNFGEYTLAKDTKKSQAITLTFNANAVNFEKTDDADITPFSAVFSANHQTLTVYFEPKEFGSWSKDLVVTVKNSQNPQLSATQTIHLTGNAIRNNVTYTCNIADNYDVDADALNLAALWTSNNKEHAPAYEIVSFTPTGNNNEGATAPAIDENNVLSLGQAGTLVLSVHQPQTQSFNEKSDTKTISINKLVTTSNGEDYIIKVNETKTANYGFTNTSRQYPSNNLTDDFYYTIDDPNFENAELNNGTELITYNPATNQITGHNAGTTKITFFQKETYKYTGATLMCNIAVEKRENQINNSWSNVWQKAMSENGAENISFTSTHGDYANYPIAIEQIYGEEVATLSGNASAASITTNTTKGYAIWHLSQAENYEYGSAEADVMVMVGVPAPPTCYVYQDNSEHEFTTSVWDAEGHFETPIAINAPIDKIWYSARRQLAGVNYFVVQYSTDNGKTWSAVSKPDLGTSYGNYSATFPAMSSGKMITNVRFGAQTGATLRKYYKDVRISRKAYLNIQDAEKKKISKLPTMTCTIDETSSAEAKFYIDYSTCADEIIIESSNTENFTVSRTSINVSEKHDNLTSNKEEITVTYHSTELGTHNAVITIRTSYQACALSVSGETTKRTPTLTWQEGFTNNPLTLPVGLIVNSIKPAATTTSNASIMYESSDENVVKIIDNGYAFQVVGLGSAILTATVPENDKWKSVSDTRVIHATEKVVQEIVWNQTFPRFMKPNDVIDLDAKVFLRNLSTNALTYSEERSQEITYSCPLNNGIVSVSGNQMTILNYGEVKVKASVSGNADYEAAAPVIVLINVRQPSAGCATPLALNKEDVIDMFEMDVDFSNYFNLTTEEMVSDEIALDPAQGKPDKLSFQYGGEVYKVPVIGTEFFGGFIKFEQRVNSQWIAVENSRVETVKNEWKTKNDLQLDENADALRIIRESGATGHHYIKDIQVTRKQYLRATKNEINLGEITMGQTTPVIIGFEYSDVKGDLTARTVNNTTDVTIKDNGAIDLECGSFGHYDLPVTFTPTHVGDWEGTVEVYDNIANLSITVQLSATVNANEEYIFNQEGNWNTNTNWTTNLVPDENADIIVAKNMTINSAASVKSMTIEEDVTVTVQSGVTLHIGKGTPKSRTAYGSLHVEDGAQVILDEEASLPLKDIILDAKLGITEQNSTSASSSGQITHESQLVVNGDAYFQLTLDPSGRNTLGWYDFVLPFAVDVIGGISIKGDEETPMQFNVNYAVMDYSEAKRAVNGKCWNKFRGTMEPGKVYTITLDEENPKWNTVIFKKKAGADVTGDRSFTTEYSGLGTDAKDNGWNGLGNGTLHHTELDVPDGTLIQMYDHTNRCYQPREAKDYTIPVGLSFFMQFDGVETINLEPAEGNSLFRAPSREPRQVSKFRLSLKEEGAENAADKLWVSANEEATGEYVIGQDVLKMGTINESKVARLWSVRNNITLCSNDMPMTDNTAEGVLGLYAPKAGYYTIEVENGPEDAALYLTHNGEIIWDLTASPYVLDLAKGTNNGYGLRIEARAPQIATGVDNTEANAKTVRKVLIGDKIYLITPEGKMYDAAGKGVKF